MKPLKEFEKQFPTDEACKVYLAAKRWPDGVRCPRCNRKERVYSLKARPFHWTCCNPDCGGRKGYRFSVITHTIFQDTKIPLTTWFRVGYLMLTAKKSISSLQIHRVIFGEESGSDWRTSWYICHRWRAAMRGDAFPPTGTVEVDESYFGGKNKNKHKGKRHGRGVAGKVPVIGAIARKGNVVAQVAQGLDAETMTGFVREMLSEKVDLVATDEHPSYVHLKEHFHHESVDHSRDEYVRGEVHTQHIDSFWSLLKRGVVGQFHHVSKKYLPLYLNEFSYRHNNRENPDVFDDLLTTCS